MIALIDERGECAGIVASLDGVDRERFTVVEDVPEPVHDHVWDAALKAFKRRPPNASEQLRAEQLWSTLEVASAAQIDTWLSANMTSLADARRVMKLLLLALRALAARGAI